MYKVHNVKLIGSFYAFLLHEILSINTQITTQNHIMNSSERCLSDLLGLAAIKTFTNPAYRPTQQINADTEHEP